MTLPRPPTPISVVTLATLSMVILGAVQGQALSSVNGSRGLTGFPPCDALIAANLSHALYLPSDPRFVELVDEYWSLKTRKAPWCFVLPSTVFEVSQTIIALQDAGNGAGDWQIAMRSGGHGSDDSNNVVNGVTIDLSQLNATTYNVSTKIASIGTGARWLSVYSALEQYGVGATGGRQGVVGVGGLTLGGGYSYYTPRNGFACDSVVNYEVVLASGEVINANASSHADLWRALKGGGSNFGIVTRFDVETFLATNLTMETRVIGSEHAAEVADAVVGFTNLDRSYSDNAMLTLLSYNAEAPGTGITLSVIEVNTMDNANTTAFDAFNCISQLQNTTSSKSSLSLANAANQTVVAGGTLNAGSLLTFANDKRVVNYAIQQHASLVDELKATIAPNSFSTVCDLQPLPAFFAKISAEKGGNMLGLSGTSRNKILFTVGVLLSTTESKSQYSLVYQLVSSMTQKIDHFAKSIGMNEEFVFLNYAHANENPLGSYGTANVEHIRQVAKKYDYDGFFQSRVSGGFKITRVI